MYIDEHLNWDNHVDYVKLKVVRSIESFRKLLYTDALKTLNYILVYPYLTYGIEVWGTA